MKVAGKLMMIAPLVVLGGCSTDKPQKPNILLAIADDMSYDGFGAPGYKWVADHGVRFTNAYASSPGSSPSRASLLTGLHPWQIAEAGTHASSFPSEFECYTDILAESGYNVGFTGKGWGPGNWEISGRTHNPAGPAYNDLKAKPPYPGMSNIDYSSNFTAFLDSCVPGQPFCFWFGANEPHRPYTFGSSAKEGKDLSEAVVPDYLPDSDTVRTDLLDYKLEIEHLDRHLVTMLDTLRVRGLLDNTIVIVTADNGMPFPHAKANCYDYGVHVPLAICWGRNVRRKALEESVVSLVDIFPTLMELTGNTDRLSGCTGFSLVPFFKERTRRLFKGVGAFSGRERHSSARPDNQGYPIRSVRQGDYLLIHNFHPERWPAGDPLRVGADGSLELSYADIDDSPTKQYMENHSDDYLFAAGFGKRPEYELYDVVNDPSCLHNLIDDPQYSDIAESLRQVLSAQLQKDGDPRVGSDPEIWESYPRLAGRNNTFPR